MPRNIATFWNSRVVHIGFFSLALIALAGGCAAGKKPRAVVKGNVTWGAGPLSRGQISFFSANDPASVGTAEIVDGKYEVKDAPVGDVKITVVSASSAIGAGIRPAPMPKDMAGMPADMIPEGAEKPGKTGGRGIPVPDKYKDYKTTDLTFTVQRGENEYNIPLKP
jgi:hypothetical protein